MQLQDICYIYNLVLLSKVKHFLLTVLHFSLPYFYPTVTETPSVPIGWDWD